METKLKMLGITTIDKCPKLKLLILDINPDEITSSQLLSELNALIPGISAREKEVADMNSLLKDCTE